MYKLIKDLINNEISNVKRLSDNAFVPLDPDNRDYQDYQLWLEAGNTPEPADE